MPSRLTRILLASAIPLVLGVLPAQAQSWGQYGIDVLPMPLGYAVDRFGAVNDGGQVATFRLNGSVYESFLWDADSGSFSSVGSLGGSTFALSLNNAGDVVGYSYNGSGVDEAFLYDGSSTQGLGTLGQPRSFATGINDDGTVVGFSTNADRTLGEAFIYDGSGLQGIGGLPSPVPLSAALGINEAGDVVGSSLTSTLAVDGFKYDGTSMQNLGGLGGGFTEAYDINDAGQVVGVSFTGAGTEEAFLFDGTTLQGLGTMGGSRSYAHGISEAGQVIGWARGGSLPQGRAVLWEGGTGYFLDAIVGGGWTFAEGFGISQNGTVVAYGRNADYEGGALTNVVLRQRPMPVAVPEPATLLLLLSSILGLAVSTSVRGRRTD